MPPSRLPRHAAAEATPRRATVVPAVLLSSMALAFGGLAVLPAGGVTSLKVTAAAATAPFLVESPATVPSNADYDTLYGIPDNPPLVIDPAPKIARQPARASRSRRAAPATEQDFVRPITGRLTSAYKWRWGRMHTGIDVAAPYGNPVRAVGDGTVLSAGYSGGYGKLVKIQLTDGTVTYYAHNSRLLVVAGERVEAGAMIAAVGSTGQSTGPHVHFEVRIDGSPNNPIPWLRKRGVSI